MDWHEWVGHVYRAVDRKNTDEFVSYLTDDASFRFADNEPVEGRDAVRTAVQGFFDSIAGLRHRFAGLWKSDNSIILLGDVDYTLLDGGELTLPFVTIYRMDDGLARSAEMFIDPDPLFAP